MAHVITSLCAVLALLIQGALVQSHVHAGNLAAAHEPAVAAQVADAGEPGSKLPAIASCAFCQSNHAGAQLVSTGDAGAVAPVDAVAVAARPADDSDRPLSTVDAPRSRAPPASSFLSI